MLPTPMQIEGGVRVYFSSCDSDLRGRVFMAQLGSAPNYPLIRVDSRPVLDIGPPGSFDADGVNPSAIVEKENELLLYYIGWQRLGSEIPYTLTAGIAKSRDGGVSFEKLGIMLPLSPAESLFRTAPFVFREAERWATLYIGGSHFITGAGGKRLPIYSLRKAESVDGFVWPKEGRELLAPDVASGEIGFGRPVLAEGPAGCRIVLSVRNMDGYRLCEAPWNDGKVRRSLFTSMLELGPDAWDSHASSFGTILRIGQDELLFYNGNEFGRSGFGIARRPASAI